MKNEQIKTSIEIRKKTENEWNINALNYNINNNKKIENKNY